MERAASGRRRKNRTMFRTSTNINVCPEAMRQALLRKAFTRPRSCKHTSYCEGLTSDSGSILKDSVPRGASELFSGLTPQSDGRVLQKGEKNIVCPTAL